MVYEVSDKKILHLIGLTGNQFSKHIELTAKLNGISPVDFLHSMASFMALLSINNSGMEPNAAIDEFCETLKKNNLSTMEGPHNVN